LGNRCVGRGIISRTRGHGGTSVMNWGSGEQYTPRRAAVNGEKGGENGALARARATRFDGRELSSHLRFCTLNIGIGRRIAVRTKHSDHLAFVMKRVGHNVVQYKGRSPHSCPILEALRQFGVQL